MLWRWMVMCTFARQFISGLVSLGLNWVHLNPNNSSYRRPNKAEGQEMQKHRKRK